MELSNFLNLEISYIFSKKSFSYISGNGNPKKFLIFKYRTSLHFSDISGSIEMKSSRNEKNPFLKKLIF